MNRQTQLKQTTALFLITLGLACFGLLPAVKALSPAPDGGYPNFTTAEGDKALFNLTTGAGNTASGWRSLFANSTGNFNTGLGAGTLVLNTGDGNTAVGAAALLLNTTAAGNTAVGADAMLNNTTGEANTAIGGGALFANTIGGDNTGVGSNALLNNTTGGVNIAVGFDALMSNMTGTVNTAVGAGALANSGGNRNTAIGAGAGSNLTNGDSNVYIGSDMGGVATESEHTYIRNINATSVSGGGTDTVTVDLTSGLLGHLSSSRRYKEDIQQMNNASETLYRLKPVTYRYKKEIDRTQSPAFGLIAEDVAEVNPALVANDAKGQPESIHYEMVNAMLLNEFLKEHKAFVEEQRRAEQQAEAISDLQQQVEALTKGIQKLNAQLATVTPSDGRPELSKATPEIASNGH